MFDRNSLDTLTRLGVKLISVRPSTQLHWDAAPTGDPREAADVTVIGDATGRLKSWFDTHPVGFVIVRPDRYVAAAALVPARRLRHHLTGHRPAPHLRRQR